MTIDWSFPVRRFRKMSSDQGFLCLVCQDLEISHSFTIPTSPTRSDRANFWSTMDGTRHILIVDDDKELRALLSNFLARHGYRVSVAQNGAAMMQALGAARIDLIVLDIMMPGEDGLSICRRLRVNGT